jgi:hypothetical protein
VTPRSRTVVHISDEQVAEFTELLENVLRLTEQFAEDLARVAEDWARIAEDWARVGEHWDEIVTCDAATIGKGNVDSIVSEECGETRRLSQMLCIDTQVIKNKSRWKVR